jgi:hypothetical protein
MVPVSKALDRLVEPNGNIYGQDFVFYKTINATTVNCMYFNKKYSSVIYSQDPKVFGPPGSGFRSVNICAEPDPAPAPSNNKEKKLGKLLYFNCFMSF